MISPMTYELIRAIEKRTMYQRPRYTIKQFNSDFEILNRLYRLAKTERIDMGIDIYFKIKFFRQLEKFPFINPQAYMCLPDGLDLAVKDVGILAFSYFFI